MPDNPQSPTDSPEITPEIVRFDFPFVLVFAKAELSAAIEQRDEAQRKINACAQQIASLQQQQQQAQAAFLVAEGAVQQASVFFEKFSALEKSVVDSE